MADLSIKNLGIGLASSLLAGAISQFGARLPGGQRRHPGFDRQLSDRRRRHRRGTRVARGSGWFELACYTQHAPEDARSILVAESDLSPPPYVLLSDALDALVADGLLSEANRIDAEWVCWSGVQGFTELAIRAPLQRQERSPLDELADRRAHLDQDWPAVPSSNRG